MIVDVRHGLTGEGVLQFETESNLSGWDLMVKLAAVLGLQTPYQVTVNPERMINDMSPLHVIQPDPLADRLRSSRSALHRSSHAISNGNALSAIDSSTVSEEHSGAK